MKNLFTILFLLWTISVQSEALKNPQTITGSGLCCKLKSLNKSIYMTNLQDSVEESWKPVLGYEGYYEVSNLGNVKSLKRRQTGNQYDRVEAILKPSVLYNGYLQVCLAIGQTKKKYSIHRLVAIAFLPNPENKPQVNHKNGIKGDPSLKNLEWATRSENMQHAYDTGLATGDGTARRGEKNAQSKYSREQVVTIKTLLKEGLPMAKIAKQLSINREYIKTVKKGNTWAWLTV